MGFSCHLSSHPQCSLDYLKDSSLLDPSLDSPSLNGLDTSQHYHPTDSSFLATGSVTTNDNFALLPFSDEFTNSAFNKDDHDNYSPILLTLPHRRLLKILTSISPHLQILLVYLHSRIHSRMLCLGVTTTVSTFHCFPLKKRFRLTSFIPIAGVATCIQGFIQGCSAWESRQWSRPFIVFP